MRNTIHLKKTFLLAVGVISAAAMLTLAGCGKKTANIPSLKYQVNDDNTVTVIGLTDKGQSDTVVTIPAEVDGKPVISVEGETFRDDQNVTQIIMEEGITRIGENVFLNCGNLEQISFPSTISEIGTNAVTGSLWEKNILDQSSEVVINHILVGLKEQTSEYVIPDGVTTIASGVFYGNTELTKITFPESLTSIGTFAFADCTGLTEVVLPQQLAKIGYSAFSGCSQLDLTVPDGIIKIDSLAFEGVKQVRYQGSLSGRPWGALSLITE